MVVSGSGSASLSCDGGGCDVQASGTGTTTLSCAGGECDFNCSGTGSCALVDCPDDSCTYACGAQVTACDGE